MRILESFKNLSKKEMILWIFSLSIIILFFVIFKNNNYITLITSLIGATALLFVSKGDVIGQILTIIF